MFSRELIESCIASPAELIEALLTGEMHEYEEDGSVISFCLYGSKILITDIEIKEKINEPRRIFDAT